MSTDDNPLVQVAAGLGAIIFWLGAMALYFGLPVLIGLWILDLFGIVEVF